MSDVFAGTATVVIAENVAFPFVAQVPKARSSLYEMTSGPPESIGGAHDKPMVTGFVHAGIANKVRAGDGTVGSVSVSISALGCDAPMPLYTMN